MSVLGVEDEAIFMSSFGVKGKRWRAKNGYR